MLSNPRHMRSNNPLFGEVNPEMTPARSDHKSQVGATAGSSKKKSTSKGASSATAGTSGSLRGAAAAAPASPENQIHEQLADVKAAIAKVETKIAKVENKISTIEDQLKRSKEIWKTDFDDDDREVYENKRSNWVRQLNRKEEQLNREKEQLNRKEEQLRDEKKQLSSAGPGLYCLKFKFFGSKKTKGVRRVVYDTAQRYGWMYTQAEGDMCICYPEDGDDLVASFYARNLDKFEAFIAEVRDIAQFKGKIDRRSSQVKDKLDVDILPPVDVAHYSRLEVEGDVNGRKESAECAYSQIPSKRSFSSLSAATEAPTELTKYQSIQGDASFRRDTVHLVSQAELKDDEDFVDDDNNKLSMSKDLHAMFDPSGGSHYHPPLFAIRPSEVQERFVLKENSTRQQVSVDIECFTYEVFKAIGAFMKDGTTHDTEKNTYYAKVFATDPVRFKRNLLRKYEYNTASYGSTSQDGAEMSN